MRIIITLFFLLSASSAYSAAWGSQGEIHNMYIYPDYVVITQGATEAGPGGCQNSNSWSFSWSSFDDQTQSRIHSMLLTAYVSKTPIMPLFDGSSCGPEGKKKFTGHIHYP